MERKIRPGVVLDKYRIRYPYFKTVSVPVAGLERAVESFKLNLDPDYQRGLVWTDENSAKFVGHLLSAGNIPVFWINSHKGSFIHDVIDGKQRLNAVLRWVQGDLKALMANGDEVSFSQMDEISLRLLEFTYAMTFHIVEMERDEVLDFYRKLNFLQVPHGSEEYVRIQRLIESTKAVKAREPFRWEGRGWYKVLDGDEVWETFVTNMTTSNHYGYVYQAHGWGYDDHFRIGQFLPNGKKWEENDEKVNGRCELFGGRLHE